MISAICSGVAWATLRKHYGKYMPRQGASEMEKLRAAGGASRALSTSDLSTHQAEIGSETSRSGPIDSENRARSVA